MVINITLTGRPLLMNYQMSGISGVGYRNGVLTINPQWWSMRDSLPSYSWAVLADKMIKLVKSSPRVSDMVNDALDKVEQKLG